MKKRVVITGLGPVTPIGIGKQPFWDALISGKSGAQKIHFDDYDMDQFSSKIACPINGFFLTDWIESSKDLKYLGRASQLALAGSKLALEDAGIEMNFDKKNRQGYYRLKGVDQEKCGIILGVGGLNADLYENSFKNFLKNNGPRKISPFALPNITLNAVSVNIAIKFGLKGLCLTVSSACTSASHAIAEAYKQIMTGKEDMILTGGAEAAIMPTIFGCFVALNAMSKRNDQPEKASRPFDKDRDGFVMGEGSGIIVLEELNHALQRGAPIKCEIIGYGLTTDAYHITVPDPSAEMQAKAIREAVAMGDIHPEEIDYINAHGTSTPLNDTIETLAIKKALGESACKIPISATKSMTGHLIGACGGVEVIATALMMENNKIHQTLNLDEPDPGCDLNYVPGRPIQKQIKYALKNSFGFGGQNAVLLLKKEQGPCYST